MVRSKSQKCWSNILANKLLHNVHVTTLSRQSAKFAVNRQRKNVLLAILFAASFFCWMYVISKVTYLNTFTIQTVKVVGADADITPNLSAAALESLQGDYLGIFSKANTFLYAKSRIAAAIKALSPRIDEVSVSREGWTGLNVSVSEKSPAALACTNLPNFNSDPNDTGKCYFVDSSGMLYVAAPSLSGNVYNNYFVPDLDDNSVDADDSGKYLATSTTFKELQQFYDGVRKSNISPLGILLKGGGEYELYIANPHIEQSADATSTPVDTAVIYFNERNDFDNELANLVSFWSHMSATAGAKKVPPAFDTIDLRYGSNVFYRLSE